MDWRRSRALRTASRGLGTILLLRSPPGGRHRRSLLTTSCHLSRKCRTEPTIVTVSLHRGLLHGHRAGRERGRAAVGSPPLWARRCHRRQASALRLRRRPTLVPYGPLIASL